MSKPRKRQKIRRSIPKLPRLPFRRNRRKKVTLAIFFHVGALVAGISLLANCESGSVFHTASFFLLPLSLAAVVLALRIPASTCPDCEGAIEIDPEPIKTQSIFFVQCRCSNCDKEFEYVKNRRSHPEAP